MPYYSRYMEKRLIFPLLYFLIERKTSVEGKGLKREITIPLADFKTLPNGLLILSEPDKRLLKEDLEDLAKEKDGELFKIISTEVMTNFVANFDTPDSSITLLYDGDELAMYYKELAVRDKRRERAFNIDSIIGNLSNNSDNGVSIQQLPIPASTPWEAITFKFVSEQEAVVLSEDGRFESFSLTPANLKFENRNRKPSVNWLLLVELSQKRGEVIPGNTYYPWNLYKKRKQLLSQALQSKFNNQNDPFYPYRGTGGYKIKIVLIPEPIEIKEPSIMDGA